MEVLFQYITLLCGPADVSDASGRQRQQGTGRPAADCVTVVPEN